MNHMPGPWTAIADTVVKRGNKIDIIVARCDAADERRADANACLIAEAPEMLAVLQGISRNGLYNPVLQAATIAHVRAILARLTAQEAVAR